MPPGKILRLSDIQNLYHIHYREIYVFIYNYTRNHEESQDISQDVFFKISEYALKKEPVVENARALLYKIARNHCINIMRANKNRDKVINALQDNNQVSHNPDIESQVDQKLLLENINAFLESDLNELERTVFQLKHFHGLILEDIAAATGISPATAHRLIKKTEKRIKKKFHL